MSGENWWEEDPPPRTFFHARTEAAEPTDDDAEGGEYAADVASIRDATEAAEPPPDYAGPTEEPFDDERDLAVRHAAIDNKEEFGAWVKAGGIVGSPGGNGERPTSEDDEATPDKLRFTDVDNSTRFALLHGDKLRYIPKWKKWLIWDTHSWVVDEDKVRVLELGKDVSRSLYQDRKSVV